MEKVKSSSNATSKFKTYLIDKLLNEQKQETFTSTNNNSTKVVTNKFDIETTNNAKLNSNNLTESKEDLHSETGTYTIEDLDDNNEDSKKVDNNYNNHQSLSNINLNNLRQSTTSTNIDLVSARAAIDETFGIIDIRNQQVENKLNKIQQDMDVNETNLKSKSDELQKLNRTRARNQTYSLTKDLLLSQNNNEESKARRDVARNKPVNSSFSASSSSSVSSSITGPSSVDIDSVASLKKTKTYDIMPNNFTQNENLNSNSSENFNEKTSQPASTLNTSRTIGTDLLMGDTDKLIEQLNKKKSKKISKETVENQKNNESNLNCSSSSGGSSNNLNQNERLPSHSKTTQKVDKNDLAFSTRLSQSWTIPNEEINGQEKLIETTNKSENKSRQEESDENYLDYIKLNKFGNGGISFDFVMNKDANEENESNLKNSRPKPVLSSSISTPVSRKSSDFTNTTSLNDSLNTQLTLTAKFEMASNKRPNLRNSYTTNDECSPLNSAKSTNVSLGTKIKSQALANKETEHQLNSSFNDTSSVVSTSSNNGAYVNRALLLRQQSAKAKLLQDKTKSQSVSSSMTTSVSSSLTPKKSIDLTKDLSSSRSKTNSILKKTPSTPATKSTNNLSSTFNGGKPVRNSLSRTSSRNTSPSGENNRIYRNTNNNYDRSLMTTSLNLPNGSSLPNNNLSFQRRKNYDPLKAVEQEKLKKAQSRLKESSKINEINNLANESTVFDDDLSDISYNSFTIPTQRLAENISNKQTYENILQSTLQRLCIRLIQTSTGVLDKIGDNSSKNIESNSIFNNAIPQTELERMQQLAKLVNSMQLVNEHLQIIDSTLFIPKPDDSYIKELTRIRQEVDTLKQNAALNVPINSPIKITNGLHGINKTQ